MYSLAASNSPATVTPDDDVSVLWVDDDPDYLELATDLVADERGFEVTTETSPLAATGRLDGVDCVVSDFNMPRKDGLELLAAVRERRPTLPFVLCTGSSVPDVVASVTDDEWAELVRKDGGDVTVSLVVSRSRRLVADRRRVSLAARTMAGLDQAGDAIAVADPDDRFVVVNRAFGRRFGYDRETLLGRKWSHCFPDDEVERLSSTALRTVSEDWRWTGGCVGRRTDGTTFTAQARIAGLDDDSVVFCLSDGSDGDADDGGEH